MFKKSLSLLIFIVGLSACSSSNQLGLRSLVPSYELLLVSDMKWEQLNPARGDKSPQAATLWGNRTGPGPAGFLLKPVDGFKSPPHIHNVAYRGVVISGLLHNDHPEAEMFWMSTGSYWTQPEGGVHITAAKGDNALAYIEVEDNFGVLPADKAFDSNDKAINLEPSKIQWLDVSGKLSSAPGVKMAPLWGGSRDDQLGGQLLMLPARYSIAIHSRGSVFRAIVIHGVTQYQNEGKNSFEELRPGSCISSSGNATHQLKCDSDTNCLFYVRFNRNIELFPASKL